MPLRVRPPLFQLRADQALSAYKTKFFIILFERAFKVIKNGVYFIVIALLVAELFKILTYANYMTCDIRMWTQSGVQSQKKLISPMTFPV